MAHATLHECLVTTAELLAPFCPFLADAIYVPLTGEMSVHLADWPVPRGRHDPELAAQVTASRQLVALGRAARTEAKIKVRQPLRRALVLHPGIELDEDIDAEIRSELNVKALERIDTLSGLMSWTVLPNFRALGPRLGPQVNEVKAALAAADGSALQQALATEGFVDGRRRPPRARRRRGPRREPRRLRPGRGRRLGGGSRPRDRRRPCAREGQARELVRALNDLRKSERLAISDRAVVSLTVAPELRPALDEHRDWIASEVLATRIDDGPGNQVLEVDGYEVRAGLAIARP